MILQEGRGGEHTHIEECMSRHVHAYMCLCMRVCNLVYVFVLFDPVRRKGRSLEQGGRMARANEELLGA